MIGKTFGRWTVVEATDKMAGFKRPLKAWICQCDCAKKTKRLVSEVSLLNGKSMSCGKCPDKTWREFNPGWLSK